MNIKQFTKAKFVRGPNARIDIPPGFWDTVSTKNSDAVFSIFLPFGNGKNIFPNPSEP